MLDPDLLPRQIPMRLERVGGSVVHEHTYFYVICLRIYGNTSYILCAMEYIRIYIHHS